MPVAICDSDDSETEIYVEDDSSSRSLSASAPPVDVIVKDRASQNHCANTNSTEKLQRQLQSATRKLCDSPTESGPSTKNMSAPDLSNSPVANNSRRRHTTEVRSDAVIITADTKKVKRTNTTSNAAPNPRFFAQFAAKQAQPMPIDRPVSPTWSQYLHDLPSLSQSADTDLPYDFREHEPAVMFRETGSTVADGELSQVRLLQQALDSGKVTSDVAMITAGAESQIEESPKSPYGSSVFRGNTQTTRSENESQPREPRHLHLSDTQDAPESQEILHSITVSHGQNENMSIPDVEPEANTMPSTTNEVSSRQTMIPVIPVVLRQPSRLGEDLAQAEQSVSGNRKRKAPAEQSDLLNSDEIAIGLPREMYQPRPSRRRATANLVENIDYSVVPEKAVKLKRRKTADPVCRLSVHSQAKETILEDQSEATNTTKRKEEIPAATHDTPAAVVATKMSISEPKDASLPSTAYQETPPEAAVPHIEARDVFIKPSLPSSAMSRKSRRSKTTIFEDSGGSQRSPSLSQQQAARLHALKDITNSPASKSKSRWRVVLDDSDEDNVAGEEDELACGSPLDGNAEAPPRKSKRGRPAKGKAKKIDRVQKDDASGLDNAVDELAQGDENAHDELSQADDTSSAKHQSEAVIPEPETNTMVDAQDKNVVAEQPKKRGRGRPPKKQVDADPAPPAPENEIPEQTADFEAAKDAAQSNGRSAPSDDRANEKSPSPASAPQEPDHEKLKPPKSSPIKADQPVHSPIRPSWKGVKFQGLSKRQRIQPLLSRVNPRPSKSS